MQQKRNLIPNKEHVSALFLKELYWGDVPSMCRNAAPT